MASLPHDEDSPGKQQCHYLPTRQSSLQSHSRTYRCRWMPRKMKQTFQCCLSQPLQQHNSGLSCSWNNHHQQRTSSGRVIWNMLHYEQSVSKRSQGLVAWEVLLDQHEQEDAPTTATQYATQRALEDPIAFAASNNPDILYWDQVMPMTWTNSLRPSG